MNRRTLLSRLPLLAALPRLLAMPPLLLVEERVACIVTPPFDDAAFVRWVEETMTARLDALCLHGSGEATS